MRYPMLQMMKNTAKRVYKPIADSFIRYNRNHPILQSRIVIPVREAIARTAPQLRMKNLELRRLATSASAFTASALKKVWLNFIDPATMFCTCVGLLVIAYTHKKKAERREARNKKIAEMEEGNLRRWKELEELKKKNAESLKRIDEMMKNLKQTPGMDALPK